MKVENLMTRSPRFCEPEHTLADAVGLMEQHDCGSLPVVAAGGRSNVLGMVTDRDICLAAYREGKALSEIPVRSAMTSEVRTIAVGDDVEEAERIMAEAQVRRLPVVDAAGELQGLVTLGQIARSRASEASEEVASTLASISMPTPGSNALPLY
jgi:CBS domain-containing protein